MSQSSTSLSAEAGKALESLQEHGSSPLVLPGHYINPSIQVQRIDVTRGPATFPPLLEDREHYVIRTAKAGFGAEVNREIIRAARMPEVVVLQTILAWDPQHLRVLMPRHYPVPVSALTTRHVFRLMQDMRRAISLLHDHDIIHADVRLANIMLRTDPASFVLIDYGGSKETIWPVRYGYTVAGRGGTQHRPPAECMNEWSTPPLRVPYLCGRSDFHRLACTIREEILGQMESEAGQRPPAEEGNASRRRKRDQLRPQLPREAEQELDMMLDTTTWKVKPNPHSLFPPGSWRDTAVNPTIMLTAHLWTTEGKSRTCTTTFRSPLERKGNSNGHFVDEPDQPSYEPGVSLAAQINTGSWEQSGYLPKIFLVCELKTEGRGTRSVAQQVYPWLSYRNRDGMLELEPPPGPPRMDPSSVQSQSNALPSGGTAQEPLVPGRITSDPTPPSTTPPSPMLTGVWAEPPIEAPDAEETTAAPAASGAPDDTMIFLQALSLYLEYQEPEPGLPSSILGALALAAGDSLQSRDSLPAPILVNEGFLHFLRDRLDEPVKVGLVPCGRSVPHSKQSAYDYVERARHDFNLKDYEFFWQIMDLDQPPDLDLYGQDPTHFQPSAELPAIGRIIGRALYCMTVPKPQRAEGGNAPETPQGNAPQTPSTSPFAGGLGPGDAQQAPHTPPPFLPVLLCCSWNATQGMIHQEMLATHALIRASTLRELLIVAASQANFPIEKTYRLTELHSSIVAEWRDKPLLSDLASQIYGWDADTLRASGPPDYFLTDLLSDPVLHPTAQGRSLAPGWHLTQTLGPIYLLQEVHEDQLRRMQGGWKSDPASTKANNDAILRGLPTALHAAQEAGNATTRRGNASTTPVPTEATIQAHVLEALDTSLLDRIVQLIEKWPQFYGELTKQQVQELIPRGLGIAISDNGDTLCCVFCAGKSGGPCMFHTSQGLLPHFLRTRGSGATWHHAGEEAYARATTGRSGQAAAAASSSDSGNQRPNEPASPPPYVAPRPAILDAPHRHEAPPQEPENTPPTMEELCAEKDFYDWVVAVADLQSLTAPEVVGVLQPQEFTAIWNARLQVLTKLPTVLAGLSRVYQKPEADRKDLSWRSVISGRLVVHSSGHLTMATKDRAGQEHIHPKLTTWLGGLQATIKNGVPYALFEGKRVATQDEFRLFATTLQTIYEAATKKAHQPSHVNIIQATRDSHPTIKITHGQVLDSKLNVIRNVTGQQLRGRREKQAEHRENKESRRSDPYGSHEPPPEQHSRSAGSQDWQDWRDWEENSYNARNSAYHGYYR
ncbi:unnamed protein product [Symbiodinium sp. CCMP2592]|nr:unnamed protein product [Symbiodinium sp. CCMP2592]